MGPKVTLESTEPGDLDSELNRLFKDGSQEALQGRTVFPPEVTGVLGENPLLTAEDLTKNGADKQGPVVSHS